MAQTEFVIQTIPSEATRHLRHLVLRPHQQPDELFFPGDDDPDTVHFGAFDGDRLIGIVSVYRHPMPGGDGADDWQVRAMAVLPEKQRQGVGARLAQTCLAHISGRGGRRVWCNARVHARPFYERLGLRSVGDVFELPEIGPHYRMVMDLPPRHDA